VRDFNTGCRTVHKLLQPGRYKLNISRIRTNSDSLRPYAIQYTPYWDAIQFRARWNVFTRRINFNIDTYNYNIDKYNYNINTYNYNINTHNYNIDTYNYKIDTYNYVYNIDTIIAT